MKEGQALRAVERDIEHKMELFDMARSNWTLV